MRAMPLRQLITLLVTLILFTAGCAPGDGSVLDSSEPTSNLGGSDPGDDDDDDEPNDQNDDDDPNVSFDCPEGAFNLAEGSDESGISHLSFGDLTLENQVTRLGLSMWESGELSLCVPDDIVSYTIFLRHEPSQSTVSSFIPAGGAELIDPTSTDTLEAQIPVGYSKSGRGTAALTPVGYFTPGVATFRFAAEVDVADLMIYVRRGDTPSRSLALNFVFSEHGATGSEIDQIEASLGRFTHLLSLFDITLTHVGYGISSDPALDPFVSQIDNYIAVSSINVQQMANRPALADNALSVFMVNDILWQSVAVNGLSPAVPGYLGVPDMPGVFVSLNNARSWFGELDTDFLFLVTAHECGHWWGLHHTTEKHGDEHDHLLDTPECTPAQDDNHDGYLVSQECAAHDGPNMMFWTTSADTPVISADQRAWISSTLP